MSLNENIKKTILINSACLFYLPEADDWEYTDSVSLASDVAFQTGNPSYMGSAVHQILNTSSHAHQYANVHLHVTSTSYSNA